MKKIQNLFIALAVVGSAVAFSATGASAAVTSANAKACPAQAANPSTGYIGTLYGMRFYSYDVNNGDVFAMICGNGVGSDIYKYNRGAKAWSVYIRDVKDFEIVHLPSGAVIPVFLRTNPNSIATMTDASSVSVLAPAVKLTGSRWSPKSHSFSVLYKTAAGNSGSVSF